MSTSMRTILVKIVALSMAIFMTFSFTGCALTDAAAKVFVKQIIGSTTDTKDDEGASSKKESNTKESNKKKTPEDIYKKHSYIHDMIAEYMETERTTNQLFLEEDGSPIYSKIEFDVKGYNAIYAYTYADQYSFTEDELKDFEQYLRGFVDTAESMLTNDLSELGDEARLVWMYKNPDGSLILGVLFERGKDPITFRDESELE